MVVVNENRPSCDDDDVESDEESDSNDDDDDPELFEEVPQHRASNTSHIIDSVLKGQKKGNAVDIFFNSLKIDDLPQNALQFERWNCFMGQGESAFSDPDNIMKNEPQVDIVTLEDRDYTRKRFKDYVDDEKTSHPFISPTKLYNTLRQPVGQFSRDVFDLYNI